MEPGEVLFLGDSFRTASNAITILHCSSRQVFDVPAHASGVVNPQRLSARPVPTGGRSVPECEMPPLMRKQPAGESHLGESIFGARLLTPSDIANPAISTEPGIARLLKQLAGADRTHRDPEAFSLSRSLFNLWPTAAWLRVKVFEYGRATAAREQPPIVTPGASAIVIGISKYKDPAVPPIQWADEDALMIRDFLKSKRGGLLPDGRISLLLNERATLAAIRAAFDKVLVQRTSTVIIFVAAHGYQDHGQGYISAYDTSIQNLRDKGVPLREVNQLITAGLSGVKTIFAYVDSCNSGYLQGLNSIGLQAPQHGRLFGFAASRTNERSYEDPDLGGGHGVFSWYLNQALTATGPRTAAVSTITAAVRYVQDHVKDFVKRKKGQEQHPVEFGNYDGDSALVDFSLPGPTPKLAQTVVAAAESGVQRLLEPDQRLELENQGEATVLRYLAGEADPLKRDEFEAAAENFDKARKLAPESVWLESRSAFAHGRVAVFDRKYDEAIRLLNRSVQLDPTGAIAYNALGIAYLEQAQHSQALSAFTDAVNRAPSWAYAWHNKALAESQLGNYHGAIDSYQRAIEVAPHESAYFYLPYNLGALYQSLNRLREAEVQYRRAGELAPSKGEPDNALGTIRAIQGKRAEARRLFELALQKDPNLEIARRNLAAVQ
jgi:tetratricopeptide (TPR) repeat protein